MTDKIAVPSVSVQYQRTGASTTSILSKRLKISSQMILSCSSASRMPMQRWMPKPNEI